ncbi:MAG: 2-hydroxymuconate tautomerase [Chloroflexota bacterium]
MPIVKLEMLKGRTPDQKRALAKAPTDAVASNANVPPDQVWVVIDEVERENWASGGTLMSERQH